MAKRSKSIRNEPRLTATKLSKGAEVKLYSLSGLSVDAFFLLDENLNLLSINDAGQKMFGVSQAGVFGKCILDVIPDIKNTGIYKKYRQVLKTGKSIAAHLELGGRHLSIQVFKQGDALGMIVADITERKRMEDALRESEEKYRNLFHNAQVGLFRSRIADGKILECNDLLAKMFGYSSREECIARHITSEHYVDANVRAQEMAQMQERGKVENLEAPVTRKDGSTFWISYSATIYPERDYIEGVVIDITERKKAEEALLESEGYFHSLTDNALDVVLVIGADGIRKYVSPSIERVRGYKPEELIGKEAIEGVHPDDVPNIADIFVQLIENPGNLLQWECRLRHKDGSWRIVEGISRNSLDNPAVAGIVSNFRDITARKKAEEQLKASLQEKELLLREVNHRVKNNFQLISSLLDMVGMRARNDETIRLCASVHSRVHSMAMIHSQLYNSSSFNQIDLGTHVHELVGYLAQVYAVNGRAITPVIEAAEVYLPITQAIPCALALNEVLSNSFKHAFAGRQKGVIETSLRKSADGTVSIRVKDDGIGVPDDFDIDKVNTLGLKLARNLVQEQLNGKFQIKRDEGTEVLIEFKA